MGFSESLERSLIWQKARPLQDRVRFPWPEWGMDEYGNIMRQSHHGDRSSPYGWEIDHTFPTSFGGPDIYANKRSLHWRANVGLGGIARALLNPTK